VCSSVTGFISSVQNSSLFLLTEKTHSYKMEDHDTDVINKVVKENKL
jgi:hypothetical protein